MGHTVTIRLTKELAAWLERASKRSGVPRGRTSREQLEKARESGARPFVMRLAGCVRGARPLNAPGVFTPVKGIADTGVLVAFANANDAPHGWATQIAASVTEPLLTCEAALAETAFQLEARRWLSQC